MSKLEGLRKFLYHCETKKLKVIELVWDTGERSGIGNPVALEILMRTIKEEIKRQIKDEESK